MPEGIADNALTPFTTSGAIVWMTVCWALRTHTFHALCTYLAGITTFTRLCYGPHPTHTRLPCVALPHVLPFPCVCRAVVALPARYGALLRGY